MCVKCVGVIFAVVIALMSLLYLSVVFKSNWCPVLVPGSDLIVSMLTNSKGLADETGPGVSDA